MFAAVILRGRPPEDLVINALVVGPLAVIGAAVLLCGIWLLVFIVIEWAFAGVVWLLSSRAAVSDAAPADIMGMPKCVEHCKGHKLQLDQQWLTGGFLDQWHKAHAQGDWLRMAELCKQADTILFELWWRTGAEAIKDDRR